MLVEADFFTSLAEIAGVFVGFGALIGAVSQSQISPFREATIHGIVLIALLVVVTSLIPLGIANYGLAPHSIWLYSSVIFLCLIWSSVLAGFHSETFKPAIVLFFGGPRLGFLIFWLAMQIPIQLPLILVILGVFESLAPALYSTALLISLFEAVFLLGLLVFSSDR